MNFRPQNITVILALSIKCLVHNIVLVKNNYHLHIIFNRYLNQTHNSLLD